MKARSATTQRLRQRQQQRLRDGRLTPNRVNSYVWKLVENSNQVFLSQHWQEQRPKFAAWLYDAPFAFMAQHFEEIADDLGIESNIERVALAELKDTLDCILCSYG